MTYLKDLYSKSYFPIFPVGEIVEYQGTFYEVLAVHLDEDFRDLCYDLAVIGDSSDEILTNYDSVAEVTSDQSMMIGLLYL